MHIELEKALVCLLSLCVTSVAHVEVTLEEGLIVVASYAVKCTSAVMHCWMAAAALAGLLMAAQFRHFLKEGTDEKLC